MPRPIAILLFTIALDGVGIGLVLPIMPTLFAELGSDNAPWLYGAFLATFALMQVVFAPILGGLSDSYGRRPVLAISLAGSVIDYLIMAFATSLVWLFVGRILAGVTSANMAVAMATVADLAPQERRTRFFGYMTAAFGLGFVVGPAFGGILGEFSTRLPLFLSSGLAALNLMMVVALLPRGTRKERVARSSDERWKSLTLLRSGRLRRLLVTFVVVSCVGEIGATVWVLHGQDRYEWSPGTIGISLAALGLFSALVQALLAGPVTKRVGERRTVVLSIVFDASACALLALSGSGWMALALVPLFCLGGIGDPAMMNLMTAEAAEDEQGRLQGLLASCTSLTAIAGPPIFGFTYLATRPFGDGLVWLIGCGMYLICLPIFVGMSKDCAKGQ